jgi:hypothetical protein
MIPLNCVIAPSTIGDESSDAALIKVDKHTYIKYQKTEISAEETSYIIDDASAQVVTTLFENYTNNRHNA